MRGVYSRTDMLFSRSNTLKAEQMLKPRGAIDLPNREMNEIEDDDHEQDGFITDLNVDRYLGPVIPLGMSRETNLGPFT